MLTTGGHALDACPNVTAATSDSRGRTRCEVPPVYLKRPYKIQVSLHLPTARKVVSVSFAPRAWLASEKKRPEPIVLRMPPVGRLRVHEPHLSTDDPRLRGIRNPGGGGDHDVAVEDQLQEKHELL